MCVVLEARLRFPVPADIELLEATEKHDMMKFCGLLHHYGKLNDVPVQDHRRDEGKSSLPKKPNLVGGPAFLAPDQTELLKTRKNYGLWSN